MLHHVYILWIIENHEQLKYDMDEQNSEWTWYIESICKKLHGTLFEAFIIIARTDRYHIMCYIDAH